MTCHSLQMTRHSFQMTSHSLRMTRHSFQMTYHSLSTLTNDPVNYPGKTGDWRNHLSAELDAKIDAWMRTNMQGSDLKFTTDLDYQDWFKRETIISSKSNHLQCKLSTPYTITYILQHDILDIIFYITNNKARRDKTHDMTVDWIIQQ